MNDTFIRMKKDIKTNLQLSSIVHNAPGKNVCVK